MPDTCPYPEPDQSSPCPPSHFLKVHLNIIIPSTSVFSSRFFPSDFPTKTLYVPLLSPTLATCLSHQILLDYHPNNTGLAVQIISSPSFSFLHSPVTSSLLGPNSLLGILFSDTLSLRSSLSVSDQISHPYKTTGEIIRGLEL